MVDNERILVVEDEPDLSRLLATRLREVVPVVDVAANGMDALRRASTAMYDLIILDLMLPAMSGMEVCRQIRAQQNYTPIIILTAKSTQAEKIAGLDAGADDYVVKPFSMDELISRARALLRRIHSWQQVAASAPRLEMGPLTIDVRTRRVARAGTPVELTAKEFDLLLLLAREPGRVYSRTELLREVWGYQHSGYRHTVDTHVSRLRSKIENDPATPQLVRTVWGVGYRAAEPHEWSG